MSSVVISKDKVSPAERAYLAQLELVFAIYAVTVIGGVVYALFNIIHDRNPTWVDIVGMLAAAASLAVLAYYQQPLEIVPQTIVDTQEEAP